jgi:uroporphyrin-III C-methyltransferase/precorrin-2 dehydrogenase/sirohydrochlorin ferrochelatase
MTAPPRYPTPVPSAIAPLAVLPVFLDLRGRRAVVAGGTPAAAWKAELLLAAGATVTVAASALSPEMAAVARAAAPGTLVHRPEPLSPTLVDGAAIVVIDAADDAEAGAAAALCRAAGVPCNVIDRPAFGTIQFGSIVNRSPVVIGISTAGVAPVLAQAVRQRMEAVLPAGLAAWAKLAARLRSRVARLIPSGAPRRRFWTGFAHRAFDGMPATAFDADAAISAATAGRPGGGHVTLVGAGPGDAGHLTLRAVQALQSADAILFDDLVTPEVLELARREARRIAVGKRGGRASCRQDDINALLVALAAEGKHVVRLKSGDAMVFGRGGEEIAAVEAAGFRVDVVPGITAASALAGRLGLSLTHRDCARSVRFVTGHAATGGLPEDLDWRGLADSDTTLVVYMAGATAAQFARRLIVHRLDAATPVVVAAGISRPGERIATLSLGDLAHACPAPSGDPVVIGIGRAFAPALGRMADLPPSAPDLAPALQA